MNPRKLIAAAAGLLLCLLALGVSAGPVMRVVVIETDDPAGYVAEVNKGKELLKRINSTGNVRILHATFAGEGAGTIVVVVEYESLSAMAADSEMIAANEEYAAWLAGLDDIRKITSDSIYSEL